MLRANDIKSKLSKILLAPQALPTISHPKTAKLVKIYKLFQINFPPPIILSNNFPHLHTHLIQG